MYAVTLAALKGSPVIVNQTFSSGVLHLTNKTEHCMTKHLTSVQLNKYNKLTSFEQYSIPVYIWTKLWNKENGNIIKHLVESINLLLHRK